MALDFPNSPTTGQLFPSPAVVGVPTYRWDGTEWVAGSGGAAGTAIYVSDTPPSGVPDNSLWWQSNSGNLFIQYNDGTSVQWVLVPGGMPSGAIRYDVPQTLTAAQQAQARANIGALKKNYIINGGMMASQENGSTSLTVASAGNNMYPADQWFGQGTYAAGGVTIQQVSVATPGGSPNRIRATCTGSDASPAAGDYFDIQQRVEGLRICDLLYGSASAKNTVLQFGCRGPAGTYSIAVRNGAASRSYVTTFAISSGQANTDIVVQVPIPGDVIGTWTTDNSIGLSVNVTLMVGSTFGTSTLGSWQNGNFLGASTTTNWMVSGNTFDLFDVGIYEGSAPPPFQVPDYPAELSLCKRYFIKFGGVANGYPYIYQSVGAAAQPASGVVTFPVVMRSTPTMSKFGTWTVSNCGQPSASNPSPDGYLFYAVGTAAGVVNTYPADATCYITANARM